MKAEACSATESAETDVKLAEVDQRRFEYLVQNTPYLAIHVMSVMAKCLRQLLEG